MKRKRSPSPSGVTTEQARSKRRLTLDEIAELGGTEEDLQLLADVPGSSDESDDGGRATQAPADADAELRVVRAEAAPEPEGQDLQVRSTHLSMVKELASCCGLRLADACIFHLPFADARSLTDADRSISRVPLFVPGTAGRDRKQARGARLCRNFQGGAQAHGC